jgi:hypothetical protein
VEHVLPQNEDLSPEWQKMLGPDWLDVRERWLHTVGNLTLTGYNSELSDRPFPEKRDMEGGFADSPLRLNSEPGKAESWDEAAIKRRAKNILGKALTLWPAPSITKDVLATYRKEPEVGARAPRENLEHFNLSETSLDLLEQFLEGAAALGLESTIWQQQIGIGKPGAGKPYPLIIFPAKGWLRVRFYVAYADLTDPPACAYAHETKTGALRTRAKIHTAEEVADCLELLPTLPILLESELDDDGDEESDS